MTTESQPSFAKATKDMQQIAREAADNMQTKGIISSISNTIARHIILSAIERATEQLRDALERSHNRLLYVKVYDKGNFNDWQEIIDQNLEAMGLGSIATTQPQRSEQWPVTRLEIGGDLVTALPEERKGISKPLEWHVQRGIDPSAPAPTEPFPRRSEQCTCDNASGLHWGKCPLNLKEQRSEQQEWTVIEAESSGEDHTGRTIPQYHIWTGEHTLPLYERDKQSVQEICDAHNAALAAERQRREQAESEALDENDKLREQFLSALAAIEKCVKDWNSKSEDCVSFNYHIRQTLVDCSMDLQNAVGDLSLLHQHDAERESEAIKRLSDVLTGGNASTWEQIFHAAETASAAEVPLVEALERIRDESTALADARKLPNSVLHIESPLRIKREANDALANAREQ